MALPRGGLGGYSTMRNKQARPSLGGVAMLPQQSMPQPDSYGGGIMAPQTMPRGMPVNNPASVLRQSPGIRRPKQQPLSGMYGPGLQQNSRPSFGGSPASGTYLSGLGRQAQSIGLGDAAAPPYRASQPELTTSQRGLLSGVRGSVNGVMPGDEQGEFRRMLPGMSPKYTPGTALEGTRTQVGVDPKTGGIALVGAAGQSNPIDFNAPQYARARDRAQADKDGRLLATAQRMGLPMSMPNVQAAMQRLGDANEGRAASKAPGKMQLARQAQIDDAIHAAHMAHVATLKPKGQIAYLQGLNKVSKGQMSPISIKYKRPADVPELGGYEGGF